MKHEFELNVQQFLFGYSEIHTCPVDLHEIENVHKRIFNFFAYDVQRQQIFVLFF